MRLQKVKNQLPYSAKRWWWKTLANSTEDYLGEKKIGDLALETSLAKKTLANE